jgi:hypothetical protein
MPRTAISLRCGFSILGDIGDGEAIVVSEGRALCGRWDVSIKEIIVS